MAVFISPVYNSKESTTDKTKIVKKRTTSINGRAYFIILDNKPVVE